MGKRVRGLLVVVLALVAAASFGAGAQESKAQPQAAPEVSVFWRVGSFAIAADNPIVQKINDKAKVRLKYLSVPWNAYTEKMNLAVASGDLPDILMNVGPSDGNSHQWAQQGILLPLDQLLKKAPNITAKVPKELWPSMKMPDGRTYWVPRLWMAPHVFLVRDDWLSKFNLKAPATLDEFYKVAKTLADDPDGNGAKDTYAYGGFNFLFWTRWISAAYDRPIDTYKKIGGEWRYCSTVPEAKDWVVYLKRLYDEGLLDPEMLVLKPSEGREKLYQGRIAMAGMRIDDAVAANAAFKKAGLNASIGVYPPPRSSSGVGGFVHLGNPLDKQGVGYWMAASITKNCKSPDAAMRVMDYLVGDEGTELAFFGREGSEYKKRGAHDYEWLVSLDAREKLGLPMYVNFLHGEPRYAEANDSPWVEPMNTYYNAASKSIYNDFLVDVPANDRIVELKADIGSFCSENLTNFIIGKRPISEFDAYIQEWYSRGGKELLAEISKEMAKRGQ